MSDCANQNLIFTDNDQKVRVSAGDGLNDFLFNKLQAGNNITLAITGPVENQKVLISTIPCCDDKFVAVDANCTPGYLENQLGIISPLTSPLSWVKDGCQMKLAFDPNLLPQDTDKYVAVDSGCVPGYLVDLMVAGTGIEIVQTGCQLTTRLKAPQNCTDALTRPYAVMMLRNSVGISVPYQRDGNFSLTSAIALPGSSSGSVIYAQQPGNYTPLPGLEFMQTHANPLTQSMINGGSPNGVITICKAGEYVVSMDGNIEVNRGTHAFRAQVWLKRGSNFHMILDGRFSAYSDTDGDNIRTSAVFGGTANDSGPLGFWIERFNVSGSRPITLQSGDQLFLAGKINSYTDDVGNANSVHSDLHNLSNAGIDGQMVFLGATEPTAGGGDNVGFNFSVYSIDNII